MERVVPRDVVRGTAIGLACAAGCALVAVFVLNGRIGREAGTAVAAASIYMVPLLAIQSLTENGLRRVVDRRPFPSDWIIYGGAKLAIGLVSAATGSALALLLGIVPKWQDLYVANRMVIVAFVVVTCASRLFTTTRRRLEERNRELEERVESESRALRLHEQDIERAREIQQALMPTRLPEVRRCDIAAECQPARVVGGDYYDAIRLGESSVAIVIGDVSGKGMAAALLMSNLQAIVRAFAGMAPAELCAKANRLIAGNVARGKYITFFYGLVDTTRMRLEYCNAGHNPPLLERQRGGVEQLGEGGPVLGIFANATYQQGAVDLHAGDCVVLYTDGITEAMNSTGDEFGEEALIANARNGGGSAEDRRQQITSAVTRFCDGAFHDDATLMVLRVD